MKALKNTLILGSVFLFGLMVTPVAAQFDSMLGKLIEGPEFVEVAQESGELTFIHKEEVMALRKTANNNHSIVMRTGLSYTITKDQFEYLVKQIDFQKMA